MISSTKRRANAVSDDHHTFLIMVAVPGRAGIKDLHPVRLAYQPPASSTFLSEQISHQQPASSTFLSEQISTSHQPPAKRTGFALN
jgi:hypothetical protein